MKKVIALGASNSRKSINKTFAIYVANQLTDVEVIVVDLNEYELPLYSPDLQLEKGFPENATQLNALLESVDGLVFSMAEYNSCYTTAFKNMFDWLSRIDQKVWKDKPMLLLGTSPGGRGAKGVLEIAKQSFPFYGGKIIADFSLPKFRDNFSSEGIKEERLAKELKDKIALFQEAITSA